ncbi:immunity 49 family protein [Nocardia crassostreae]|uniref:immunity 49 family protein n=1 Tax=Nocardia crassostreae TaxID=53428 RepID=UPI001471EC12|nr:immunity 49 family protein [Nocardia crassostreae]
MTEVVERHEMDASAVAVVDAGSVAPVLFTSPMPPVLPDGPNFARSFPGEMLAHTLLFDPHAVDGQALYFAQMTEQTITKRFRAPGIESGFDRYDKVTGWRAAFWWALIGRDAAALDELVDYPVSRLREYGDNAFDDCQYEWARILQEGWRYGAETVADQAWGLDTTSRMGAQHVLDQLVRPSLEVFARMAARDQDGFSWELANALRRHRAFFDRAAWCHDPEGVISLPLLGLACWAHDSGLRIEVESEYLPLGLILRPNWMHSPELAAVAAAAAAATQAEATLKVDGTLEFEVTAVKAPD